jgi:murein L,D-transpeptidase YcbB/YkuD
MVALAAGLAMPRAAHVAEDPAAAWLAPWDATGHALRRATSEDPALASFYARRGWRSLWLQGGRIAPESAELIAAVRRAADDGLDPADYHLHAVQRALAAAASGRPDDLARAELSLSRLLTRFAADLRTPAPGAEMIYADPAVAPPGADPRAVLDTLASGGSLADGLTAALRMSPVYVKLRAALADAHARGDHAAAQAIRPNLERARALPPDMGRRYVLVDVAAQRLELWEDGRLTDAMRVVVGKPSQPTPQLAGMIRFAVLNPYWHVPPDLAAESIAPAVLRDGPRALQREDLEAVNAFSPGATPVDPGSIDWAEVASGAEKVYLRQRPGPGNMMGQVKFIFPNPVGVYLHDTPLKGLFAGAQRTESAGCVRLSDAPRLARRLLGAGVDLAGSGAPEQRVDLPQPVPVYLVYFTVRPTASGLERRADIYGRDAPLSRAISS